ncbi:hypothetical protein FRC12_014884 [Ceratobasidium sp. 428]|nr:hypothetical protein FRC12_014884 [Ceratobasidium sp. 428]
MDNAPEIDDSQPQLVHSLHIVFEPRMLCNLGCQISCPHMAWILDDDGWIVYNGNKLVWVPPDLWEVLLLPQYISLISPRGFLQLDLDRNQLGKHWQDHFRPGVSTEQ